MIDRKKMLAIVASLLMFGGSIPVKAEDQIEVVNNVGMGNVSITLVETQMDPVEHRILPFEQDRTILPGETVSKIVNIKNEGEPAWIRARLDFSTKAEVNLNEEDCVFAEGWIRKDDGYWYWPKEVKTGESVEWLRSFYVPAEWTSAQVAKTKFHANVRADAVQSRHFDPDFKAKDPWFGTVIETSLYNYTRNDHPTDTKFLVLFEGGAEGLIGKGDDFFSNWHTLMPGDKLEDTISVKNDYVRKIKLFFRTENTISTDLEEAVNLKIYRGTDCIYDATLAGTRDEMVLAVMDPGTEFVIKYTLDVPETLGNKYDLAEGQVKWIFRSEMLGSFAKDGKWTGVDNDITLYALCGGSALAVIAISFCLSKRKKKWLS